MFFLLILMASYLEEDEKYDTKVQSVALSLFLEQYQQNLVRCASSRLSSMS